MAQSRLARPTGVVDDHHMEFTNRLATEADADRLRIVMDASISDLQKGFLTDEQIESSRLAATDMECPAVKRQGEAPVWIESGRAPRLRRRGR
jgi:hypothetical protein